MCSSVSGFRPPDGIAKLYSDLSLDQIDVLLDSEVHEHRLAALIILNAQFAAASKPRTFDSAAQAAIVDRYPCRGPSRSGEQLGPGRTRWPKISLGPWLFERPRDLLFELAESDDLWERRVAVLSIKFAFIKRGDESTTLQLCERLPADRADLIQKATG